MPVGSSLPAAPAARTIQAALRHAGCVLARARKANGWSRSQVAERCGHTRDWLGKIEAGHRQPNLDKLLILLRLYDLEIGDLFPTDPTSRRARALAVLVTQPLHKLEAAAVLMTMEGTPTVCPEVAALE